MSAVVSTAIQSMYVFMRNVNLTLRLSESQIRDRSKTYGRLNSGGFGSAPLDAGTGTQAPVPSCTSSLVRAPKVAAYAAPSVVVGNIDTASITIFNCGAVATSPKSSSIVW